ncbi:MAG: hydrogenase maturation nickel metallochaperone HypA [bacterium]
MHELSIMQSIFEIINTQASLHNFKKINKIKLKIGEIAGVLPDSLLFSFEILSKGTITEGANLEIEEIALTGRCEECKSEFRIEDYCYQCPRCKSFKITELTGSELLIDSLEID